MASASAQFGWDLTFGPKIVSSPTLDWRPLLDDIRKHDPAVLANTQFYAGDLANFQLQFIENPLNCLLYLQYGALHRSFSEIVGSKGKGIIVGTVIGLPRDKLGQEFSIRYREKFGNNSTPEVGCQPYTSLHHYATAVALAGGSGGPGAFEQNGRVAKKLKETIYRSVSGCVNYHDKWQSAIPFPDAIHDPSLGMPHMFYQLRNLDQQSAIIAPEPYSDARFVVPGWITDD